jgi:hypothetical protein
MQIDDSDGQPRKTPCSIRESFDSAWNVTVESFAHEEKHSRDRTATDDGMQTEDRDEQP